MGRSPNGVFFNEPENDATTPHRRHRSDRGGPVGARRFSIVAQGERNPAVLLFDRCRPPAASQDPPNLVALCRYSGQLKR